jgi:heme-degrading monooxygenase HmoA
MIARIWHGWAHRENAGAYEEFLRSSFLPAIGRIAGFRGAQVFRRDDGDDEVEFVTTTYFDSIDAIRVFAGDDYEVARVAPEARRLLSRFDQRCRHYVVAIGPGGE